MKFADYLRAILPLFSPVVFAILYVYFARNTDYVVRRYAPRTGEIVDYDVLLAQYATGVNTGSWIWFIAISLLAIALIIWGKRFRIFAVVTLVTFMGLGCPIILLGCGDHTTVIHIQTVSFSDAIYQLAEETTDYGDYLVANYLIYKCDPTGKKCVFRGRSQEYPSGYRPKAALLTDTAGKLVYFQFEGKSWVLAVWSAE